MYNDELEDIDPYADAGDSGETEEYPEDGHEETDLPPVENEHGPLGNEHGPLGNEHGPLRTPKKYIRDTDNPLERYDDKDFKRRFRFSKEVIVNFILPTLNTYLEKPNNRGLPIAPLLQLLIVLRFYATGSYQDVCADIAHLTQPTFSRTVFRLSTLLAAQLRQMIKMPTTTEEMTESRWLFQEAGAYDDSPGLPGIDGVIGCSHVKLQYTRFQHFPEIFRNSKGFYSLKVQAVVGPRMEFRDIVPEWPGGEHESRIFESSRLYSRYREGELTGSLVGDSCYPCLPFLLTPVANPATTAEAKYNQVHCRTQVIVERAFTALKRRFPCLQRGLANKLICTTSIMVACAVLHNYAVLHNDILDDNEEDEDVAEAEEVLLEPTLWQPEDGFAVRTTLINRLYL